MGRTCRQPWFLRLPLPCLLPSPLPPSLEQSRDELVLPSQSVALDDHICVCVCVYVCGWVGEHENIEMLGSDESARMCGTKRYKYDSTRDKIECCRAYNSGVDVDIDALRKYAPQQFSQQADGFFGNQVLVVRGGEPCKSFLGVSTQDPIEVWVKLKVVFVKIFKQIVSTENLRYNSV